MTLWLILTLLIGGAALIVLAPFFFGRGTNETPTSLDVYRDQLAEVERDKAQGLIDEAEAASARLEIERRILAAGRSDGAPAYTVSPSWQYRMVTGVSAVVVLGSVGLYGALGRPDLPAAQSRAQAPAGTQAAQTADAAQAPQGDIDALVKRLEKRLADNPNDAEGWRLLGWTYYNTARHKDAVAAYRRAVDLQKDNPTLKALLGEAMVVEAGDRVTDAALAIFEEVLAINPNDERARFFKGVSKAQVGDNQGAIDEWIALYKVAPADAEWAADLRSRIEKTALDAKIDVSARLAEARPAASAAAVAGGATAQPGAAATPGPTAADIETAKQLKPEDAQLMAAGMVERLAGRLESAPKDADGWIMLIRSRLAMKDPEKARAALEKAKTIFADEPETQKRIVEAAETMGVVAGARVAEAAPSDVAAATTDSTAASPGATATPAPTAASPGAPATPAPTAASPGAPATPGPTPADVENAKQLAPEDRQAMVAGMVDRLAGRLESAPKDPDGWIMLIRSRMAMNDAEQARAALEKAKTVFADEPETQQRIVQAAQAMGVAVN
jgi:cytochrome c-type biogenesis protein CcmH